MTGSGLSGLYGPYKGTLTLTLRETGSHGRAFSRGETVSVSKAYMYSLKFLVSAMYQVLFLVHEYSSEEIEKVKEVVF